MLQEEKVPCQRCKAGLHRVCTQPIVIPTLLAYLRGRSTATETLMCCDRKEFWTTQVYE
jgi:hypothetical protein